MIQYKKRRKYKYNLHSVCTYHTGIKVEKEHKSAFIEIGTDGLLTIRKGYAWDGPSGPTIDTKDFMRGSLVHDALYQLLREVFWIRNTENGPTRLSVKSVWKTDVEARCLAGVPGGSPFRRETRQTGYD